MTRTRAFRSLRYDPARVDLGRVVVPPYDVIAAEEREGFFARDPHNAIRLELTRDVEEEASTDYAQVRETLEAWQREAVLIRDDKPALYALRQSFQGSDGSALTREGFFALLHLEDYARGIVRPHELTMAGPKADRLKLLRATRANLSVVFLLYEDRSDALRSLLARAFEEAAIGKAEDASGAVHQLAELSDPEAVRRVCDFLSERSTVIADGHHRYETALAYRDEQRAAGKGSGDDAPHEWLLAYFANAYAPGTLLLPIHRLVVAAEVPGAERWDSRLSEWTRKCVRLDSADALPALLAEHLEPLADRHAFALDDASGEVTIFQRSRADGDDLTVRLIHRDVIEGVFGIDDDAVRKGALAFPKSALQTARDLRAGRGRAALYLNPLSPDDVFQVTGKGEVLPQKSTFFFPKLPTGLVFRLLEDS